MHVKQHSQGQVAPQFSTRLASNDCLQQLYTSRFSLLWHPLFVYFSADNFGIKGHWFTMNTRVAWLLLFTYVVLLAIGGCGVWLTANNFGVWPLNLPLPPSTTAVTPNSINDESREEYGFYSDRKPKAPDGYEEYLKDNLYYTNYTKDPRIYLVIPCGASLGIAAVLLVAGIISRKVFTTTVALYSSIGLWILTILTSVMYQKVSWKPDLLFYSSFTWILGFQAGMLILLTLQVGFAIWELRRQKSDWPVINITNVITFNTVLVVAKMTLAIYAAVFWVQSPMMTGLVVPGPIPYRDMWTNPRIHSPAYFVLPCTVACAYGLIVSAEDFLSHFFGQMHSRLVACTSLISAVCYCTVGVVASPVFVKAILGNYEMCAEVMIFTSLMSALNFLHAFTSFIFPNALETPPKFVMVIANFMSSKFFALQDSYVIEGIRETVLPSFRTVSNTGVIMKLPEIIFSSVLSLVALILVSTIIDGPSPWSSYVMMCGNVAVLTRNIPALVAQLGNLKLDPVPLWQVTYSSIIEIIVLFIGTVGAFSHGWPTPAVIAGVVNMFYVFYQIIWLKRSSFQLIKAAIIKTEVIRGPEDTHPIVETEPENTQVLSEEDQNSDPHSLA